MPAAGTQVNVLPTAAVPVMLGAPIVNEPAPTAAVWTEVPVLVA